MNTLKRSNQSSNRETFRHNLDSLTGDAKRAIALFVRGRSDGGRFLDWKIADRYLTANHFMHILKLICFTIAELAKLVWGFPGTVAANWRKRRQLAVVSEGETERLDRIRNPSKYLGKES